MYLRTKINPDPVVLPVREEEAWRKALRDAAEYIRVHGHWKHGQPEVGGQTCMVLSISTVGGGHDAIDRLRKYLGLHGLVPMYNWNDAPETTAEMVIAALEGASRS